MSGDIPVNERRVCLGVNGVKSVFAEKWGQSDEERGAAGGWVAPPTFLRKSLTKMNGKIGARDERKPELVRADVG